MTDGLAIRMRGVTKAFGALKALRDANLEVRAGEIHALVGENGAGKSTLMNVLYGLVAPDSGSVEIAGRPIERGHVPARAIAAGVGMVHQHFMLVPTLTVAENVLLGAEPRRYAFWDSGRARAKVAALAKEAGFNLDVDAPLDTLSVGEQQRVEILKLLARGARILVLDEPTAVLTPREADELFNVIRRLVTQGHAALVVTHKLDEVMASADTVTVLRAGQTLRTCPVRSTSKAELARAMFDEVVLPDLAGPQVVDTTCSHTRIRARALTLHRALKDVSFDVGAGEIVGIAGVEGNGQSELIDILTGLRCADSGTLEIDGVPVSRASSKERIAARMAHIPEDRHKRAIVAGFSIAENLMLGNDRAYGRVFLHGKQIRNNAYDRCREYGIVPADPLTLVGELSGGNQQKLVVARELARNPRVLIAAHPTRGVDLAATTFIHDRLRRAQASGTGILLLSSELSEILALANRILVMHRGTAVEIPDRSAASLEVLGALMTGTRA